MQLCANRRIYTCFWIFIYACIWMYVQLSMCLHDPDSDLCFQLPLGASIIHVYKDVCLRVQLWVCMKETACFCGCSNQPPAPSPNTCSPINIQRAGPHSLQSPSFPPFSSLFSLYSHTLGPALPSTVPRFVSAPRHTPLGLFICSHMLL